ncbi:MAG: SprB repeat-containing protein, partial [Bacteroidota bacterium]
NIMTTFDVTNVLCNGAATGAAVANIIGGNDGFTFTWSSGETTNSIANKEAGTYTVTITMGTGCGETVEEITITEPIALRSDIQILNSSSDCNSGMPTSLTATAQGGTPGYSFNWSTGQTGASINNLMTATYTVTVTDLNGCETTSTVDIDLSGGTGFAITSDVTPISCNGDTDGAIQITTQGSSGVITYEWSIPGIGNDVFMVDSLGSGTYTVTVTSGDCTDEISITLEEPQVLDYTISVNDVTCNGGMDASFQVNPTGGTAPYSFSWQDFPLTVTGNFDNVAAGDYPFLLTDANDCPTEGIVTIGEAEAIEVDVALLGSGCSMMLPTEVMASATGGNGSFSYAWSNGSTTDTLDSPPMGTYMLTVTDGLGCADSVEVVVDDREIPLELDILKTDVNCLTDDNNDGTATVMVSGGGGEYDFIWSNGDTTDMITDLTEGMYEVTVTDDTGCRDSISVQVNDPGPFNLTLSLSAILRCAGDENAAITAFTSRGTPNDFSYDWSNGETVPALNAVGQGTYTLVATEIETGCAITEEITVTEPDPITIQLSSIRDVDCANDPNGAIE